MAAMRLSGSCPKCDSHLLRRKRKADGVAFLSCSAWPSCKFAEDFDPHLNKLADELRDLRSQLADLRTEVRTSRNGASINKQVRQIIVYSHPDKWPESSSALAHGVTAMLNKLREGL